MNSALKVTEPFPRGQQQEQCMVVVGGVSANVMDPAEAAFFLQFSYSDQLSHLPQRMCLLFCFSKS